MYRNGLGNKKTEVRHTFYIAKYLRKSSEEADSRSIRNQDAVLDNEVSRIMESDPDNDYIVVDTYCDENYTGTDSDRPDFKRLLKDVGSSKVNMVMVTDLSRLSRNLSECINYVQGFFVTLDVRFFSKQLPSLDSYLYPQGIYSIEVPIQSMMNENHCAETSFKIRQTFDALRSAGKFIGAFAGYGWQKDPNDKHKLVLDEEPYQILNMMKDWLLSGDNGGGIAKKLNEKGILNPSSYKKSKGQKYCTGNTNSTILWSSGMVRKILARPENVGDLIQGRYKIRSYKIHEQIQMPEEKWFVKEGAIPAIFTHDEYESILSALSRTTRIAPQNKSKEVYLFSGFLKCSDCGKSVVRKMVKGKYIYYMCNTYKTYKGGCTKHSISHKKLENAVLLSIQKQIEIAVDLKETLEKIDKVPVLKKKTFDFEANLNIKKKELYKIANFKRSLYEDWKSGDITQQEYRDMKSIYQEQETILNQIIENLHEEITKLEKVTNNENPFITNFAKYKNINELSRELLLELIDIIIIHEGGNITIRFKFADEFKRIIDYIGTDEEMSLNNNA